MVYCEGTSNIHWAYFSIDTIKQKKVDWNVSYSP